MRKWIRKFQWTTPIVVLISVSLVSCSKKENTQIKTIDENGVPVVLNPEKPKFPDAEFTFTEELTIGEEEGDTNFVFYRASGVVADADGNIYVANGGSYQIRVFDPEGHFLYAFGQKGNGPGEFSSSYLQLAMDGHDRLYVLDIQNQRITVFSTKGERLTELTLKEGFPREFGVDKDGNVTYTSSVRGETSEERKFRAVRCTWEDSILTDFGTFAGTRMRIYRSGNMAIAVATNFDERTVFAFLPNGGLVQGVTSQYEFSIYSPEGKLLRKVRKSWQAIPVTQKEKDEMRERYSRLPQEIRDQIEFPDQKPAYERIVVDDHNRLWLRVPQPDGAEFNHFHIFSMDGEFLYDVELPVSPYFFRGDKFYALHHTEDGVEQVKRYSYRFSTN